MAEKEERITIHKVLYPCKKCSINCNKNDWKDCDFYQNYISGMSRQEAIERIAKAICAGDCENCSDGPMGGHDCIRWLEDCGKIAKAEAALNALLEK